MQQYQALPISIDGRLVLKLPGAPQPSGGGETFADSLRRRREEFRRISDYEVKVIAVLDALNTPAGLGNVVLSEIPTTKQILIVPALPQLQRRVTAAAIPDVARDANAANTIDDDGRSGSGQGANVLIAFSPGAGKVCSSTGATDITVANRDEDILLHELVHALRDTQGRRTNKAVANRLDNVEEFYAILLTNIALSTDPARRLRKDHQTGAALEGEAATSAGFLKEAPHRKMVGDFCLLDSPALARKIAPLRLPFNPIGEFLDNTKKYLN